MLKTALNTVIAVLHKKKLHRILPDAFFDQISYNKNLWRVKNEMGNTCIQ